MIGELSERPAEPWATLIADARAGDEAAFTRIVARHHADLVRIAYVVSGDLDLAAEAAQSAWVVAWRRLGDLRDPMRLRPWLMSIAANQARQLGRSQRRRAVREVAILDPTSPSVDSAVADRIDLGNALARLEPRDREIVALRYVAGMDAQEIGQAVGMPSGTVRSRLFRARERLRQELGDD